MHKIIQQIQMLNQHRFSSLSRAEQRKFSSLNEVYDQIMRNFDKQSQRIRNKFSNPTFDDSLIIRPRNTLPKLQTQAEKQKQKIQKEKKNRMKFYSNKIVVNQHVYINERRQFLSKDLQQSNFRKINMPYPYSHYNQANNVNININNHNVNLNNPSNNGNTNAVRQFGGVLSDRNKRIMQLYKRAEKDADQFPNRIRFTRQIENPNKSPSQQIYKPQQLNFIKKSQNLNSNDKRMLDILKQAKQKRKKVELPYMRPQRSKSNIIINTYVTSDPEKLSKNTIQCKKLLQVQQLQKQTDKLKKINEISQTKQVSQEQQKEKQVEQQKPRVKTMKKLKYEPCKDQIAKPIIKRRFNWKIQPFPLTRIEKQEFYRLLRYYLGIGQIHPIQAGFYKAYVGPGNNNPLIKKLLKDRGHWIIVQSLDQQPHFVWTQIKHIKFNQILPTSQQKQYQRVVRYFNSTSLTSIGSKILKQTNEIIQGQQKQSKPNININSNQNLLKSIEGNQQLQSFIKLKKNQFISGCQKILLPKYFLIFMNELKIRFKNGNNVNYFNRVKQVYIDFIQQYSLKRNTTASTNGSVSANTNYSNNPNNFYNQNLQDFKASQIKLHNHMDNSGAIGDKKGLLTMITKYCQLFDEDVNLLVPTTLHVQNSQDIQEIFTSIPNGPWVLKPGEATNRGTGITIHTSQETLINQITKKKKHKNGYKFTHIVQKYIDPLLYNGRKFDIRVWCLWSGRKLWWYKEGYLRTSSRQFTLKSLNKFIHLTNDAIQSQSQDFGKYQPANKLSFNQFQKYLQSQYNYYNFHSFILEEMKKLAVKAFRMGNLLFDPENKQHNFELFGLDFLIDNKFKPWLIQCNTNPCLEINCSLLSRLVPNMLQNVMNLTADLYFPVPLKKKPKQSERWSSQLFKFELIFDGVQDIQIKQLLENNPVQIIYKQQYDNETNIMQYKDNQQVANRQIVNPQSASKQMYKSKQKETYNYASQDKEKQNIQQGVRSEFQKSLDVLEFRESIMGDQQQ